VFVEGDGEGASFLRAVDLDTRRDAWTFKLGAGSRSAPAVADGAVLLGARDRFVYSIDATDGTLRWKTATDGFVDASPAVDGDRVLKGHALVAPGNHHVAVDRDGAHYTVKVTKGPPVNHHRPSADVLFDSCAQVAGPQAVGIILTGMGADGARGLLRLKQSGARTLAQDEESSVVFGMPKAAIELGAVDQVLPLSELPAALVAALTSRP